MFESDTMLLLCEKNPAGFVLSSAMHLPVSLPLQTWF